MQSKRKGNTVVTHAVHDNLNDIEFVVGPASFTFSLPPEGSAIFRQAALHGFVQKISDRAAIGRDPETGASASPELAPQREKAD